ncbi:hypothetical protein T484DRAFT_1768124 [Baffinella frigidus]|nr:hypothetical protein T484DRAFT_1768124 [Cryptophyta sp. CCMP2293]
MEARNPNDTSAPGDWHKGLEGLDRRYVPYNGAVSERQPGVGAGGGTARKGGGEH